MHIRRCMKDVLCLTYQMWIRGADAMRVNLRLWNVSGGYLSREDVAEVQKTEAGQRQLGIPQSPCIE